MRSFLHDSQWLLRMKPKKLDLRDCTLADMHFHSNYSKDGSRTISSILRKCAKLGVGVSIADHNTVQGSLVSLRLAKKVKVIPGVEITSNEGVHLLAYAYSKKDLVEVGKKCLEPFRKRNPVILDVHLHELLDKLRRQNCIVGAAHPFFSYVGIKTACLKEAYERKLDFVEVLNRYSLKRLNNKAYRWALEAKKGMVAGTDGRYLHDLGKTLTGVEGEVNLEGFLEAIRKRKSFVVGTESNLLDKTFTTVAKEIHILTHGGGLNIAKSQMRLNYQYYRRRLQQWAQRRKERKSKALCKK